jgi:hypothetical protein
MIANNPRMSAFRSGLLDDRLATHLPSLSASLVVHLFIVAAIGALSWGERSRGPAVHEFSVRLVAESGVLFAQAGVAAGRDEPSAFSIPETETRDLTLLAGAEPLEADESVADDFQLSWDLVADSYEPGAEGSGRDSSSEGLIGIGPGGGARIGMGHEAGVPDRERAGGNAVGGLWGVSAPPRASSFVYVLDRSGSMQDTFYLVQRELIRAIGSLEEDQRFNVIWFSEGAADVLSPRMQSASFTNKRAAFEAIQNIAPGGRTEPFDALRRGLMFKPDVLYFLSDGDFGDQNTRLFDLIRRLNATRRTTINTILFVYESVGDGASVLKRIAEMGGGRYKHVAEADAVTDQTEARIDR